LSVKRPSEKLNWANDLRTLAIVAVIVLHVAATISDYYPHISLAYLQTSLWYDSAVRWGVPIFLMLSGSFALEHYDGRLKIFFSKMFSRIILPFLFWTIVYLFAFSWWELRATSQSTTQLAAFIGKQFIEGSASHLWYVYLIVSLYLTFPIISKWTKQATDKEYLYFLVVWIVLIILNPFLSEVDNNFDFNFFTGYLGYIILGNFLFKTNRKTARPVLITLFFTAYVYTAARSCIISVQSNKLNEKFLENLSPNVVTMAVCVYLLFKKKNHFSGALPRKIVDTIATHSYGIYLAHILVLNVFLWLGWKFYFIHPLLSIPLIALSCLLISLALVVGMKKLPLLKHVAG
jgi:surface polysaccharide O-acyltransferase-like enzyme